MAGGLRVSDQSRYLGLIRQYGSLQARQARVETQISSGKRIASADEDPVAAGLAQKFHVDDARLTQNLSNIDQAKSFSEFTSSAIDSATQYIQRGIELATTAGDGTISQANRNSIATEVDQILNNLVDIGAQNYRGRYLFSGSETDTPAFTATRDAAGRITSVAYAGNSDLTETEYTPGRTIPYNLLGSNENGGDFGILRDVNDGTDVFQTLITFRDNLLSGNTAAVGSDIASIKGALNHLTIASVRAGGVQTRLDAAVKLHEDQQQLLGNALSKLEDTDAAASITELKALDTAYQSALAIGARIQQSGLLQYLR